MRILQLVHYAPLGGIESHTRNVFVALEARGHQNVLVYGGSALPGLEREGRMVYCLPGLLDRGPSHGRQLAKRAEEFVHEHQQFQMEQPAWPFNESHLTDSVTHWPAAWLRRVLGPGS